MWQIFQLVVLSLVVKSVGNYLGLTKRKGDERWGGNKVPGLY